MLQILDFSKIVSIVGRKDVYSSTKLWMVSIHIDMRDEGFPSTQKFEDLLTLASVDEVKGFANGIMQLSRRRFAVEVQEGYIVYHVVNI